MKKFLFTSNITTSITNFAIPSIEAAKKLGYDVHMAADYSNFSDDCEKHSVTLHQIDLKRFPLHPQNIKAYKQTLSLVRAEGIDVIHCNTPIGGLLGRLAGKKCKVKKVIYTAHGFHFYKGAPLVNILIYKTIEKILARFTDAIITINKEDYEAAQSFKLKKGGKVYYVPGVGIDTAQFSNISDSERARLRQELSVSDDEFLVISAGELIARKNIETSIRALADAKNKKIKFAVCGMGPLIESLQKLAKNIGVFDRVLFLGFRKDIPNLFRAADAFLFSSFQEGLPRCTMEAMAAGLPCIVSKIRGNVDLIEENKGGFLCSPHSSGEFASALDELSRNAEMQRSMGEYNQKAAAAFDVAHIKKEMLKIYQKVLN